MTSVIPSSHLYHYPITAKTERLHLRPLTMSDAPAWEAFTGDAEAVRYFPELDPNRATETAVMAMNRQMNRYKEGSFGLLALELLSTRELIGQCGLIKKSLDDEFILEIGYALLRDHWGKGYATEAATFFKQFAKDHQISPVVHSLIHVDNHASMAVAERNGMQRGRQTVTENVPVFVYSLKI